VFSNSASNGTLSTWVFQFDPEPFSEKQATPIEDMEFKPVVRAPTHLVWIDEQRKSYRSEELAAVLMEKLASEIENKLNDPDPQLGDA
jgi:hypothetical protein